MNDFTLGMRDFVAIAALLAGAPAWAGSYSVSPTRISLNAKAITDVITITNQGDTPLRIQVTTHHWRQTPERNMVLEDTQDIVIFPTLVEIGPKEARALRVGSAIPFGDTEGTYRIQITELPALKADGSVGLQMLTRANVPVFLSPAERAPKGAIAAATVVAGQLQVTAANTGNVTVTVQEVSAAGTRADGSPFVVKAEGWYVLPDATQVYTLDLPAADCPLLRGLDLRLLTTDGTWSGMASVTPEQCGPAAAAGP